MVPLSLLVGVSLAAVHDGFELALGHLLQSALNRSREGLELRIHTFQDLVDAHFHDTLDSLDLALLVEDEVEVFELGEDTVSDELNLLILTEAVEVDLAGFEPRIHPCHPGDGGSVILR